MKNGRIYIDCFTSGLEDLKRSEQKQLGKVLTVLQKKMRFSVFEATDNPIIAKTMTKIMQEGYVKDLGGGYPWTNVEITEKGLKAIQEGR